MEGSRTKVNGLPPCGEFSDISRLNSSVISKIESDAIHEDLVLSAEETAIDANPPRPLSEVDAQPIIKKEDSNETSGVSIPTDRLEHSYYLGEGVKKVIIFNQQTFASRLKLNPRRGTDVDVRSIEKTFKSLGWQIQLYNDSTVSKIREVILKQVQISTEPIAALAIFILSHGEDNGTIFAQDYPFRVDNDILMNLAADKSPGLAGRPKMVFVQACQGQETDQGTNVTERRRRHTSQDNTSTYKIPNYSDFLIFQASFWDHYSFRSSETGSWFIQALCRKINESGEEEALFDILLNVSHSVAIEKESNVPGKPHLDKKKQVPLLYSTMLRKLYLKGSKSLETDSGPLLNHSCDIQPTQSQAPQSLAQGVADLKVEAREKSGSTRSLNSLKFRKGSRSKKEDKDCRIM